MGTATAYNSGAISHKAYNATLAKTRVQNAKMSKFEGKAKDEGGRRDRGEVPTNEIQHPTNQSLTAPGVKRPVQMRGGKDRPGQPKVAHINREQDPPFAGSGASTKGTATVEGTSFSAAPNKTGRGFKKAPKGAAKGYGRKGGAVSTSGYYGSPNSRGSSSY